MGDAMLKQPILFPRMYSTYILLAALDVVFTLFILSIGGEELNAIANWIWQQGQQTGLTFFKFATVSFVLVSCEIVGRRKHRLGRTLAEWAIAINCIPVGVAVAQLVSH